MFTKRQFAKFWAAVAVILLSGCVTTQIIETPTVTEKIGKTPELNRISSASVGSVIFSQFRYWSKTGYRLEEPVSIGLALGQISSASGDFLVRTIIGGKPAFCTERKAYVDPFAGPIKSACYLDLVNSGRFTHVTAAPGAVWFEKALPVPIRYSSSEITVARPDAVRYELTYLGSSNKSLRLAYREFIGDLARPAFAQDVTYDIDQFPLLVTFRKVRIEILDAGNAGLKYQVLSDF